MKMRTLRGAVALAALAAVRCGSEEPLALRFAERTDERTAGDLLSDGTFVEFASTASTPLAGVVSIDLAAAEGQAPLSYELRYDYAAGTVASDGHAGRLARPTLRVLTDAAARLGERLGTTDPELPLHEQLLFAAFVLLSESGGMPLSPLTFELATAASDDVDKSIGNDGVGCLERGATYLVSFDFGSTQVIDTPIVADSHSCNGMCGPSCTQLTPSRMWTLDCLEHDSCCSAIGDDTTCWTPLGECGDEYADAEADFLRGFDPFRSHCSG